MSSTASDVAGAGRLTRWSRLTGVLAALVAAATAFLLGTPGVPYAPASVLAAAVLGAVLALLAPGRSLRWLAASLLLLVLSLALATPGQPLAAVLGALLVFVHGETAHAILRIRRLAILSSPADATPTTEGANAAEGPPEGADARTLASFHATYVDHARRPLLTVAAVVGGAALLQAAVVLADAPASVAESLEFQGVPGLLLLVLILAGALVAWRARGSRA